MFNVFKPSSSWTSPYNNDIYSGITRFFAFGKLQAILNLIPSTVHEDSAVVDFGCGFGYLLLSLAKFFKSPVGIDFNPTIGDTKSLSQVFCTREYWEPEVHNKTLFDIIQLLFKTQKMPTPLLIENRVNTIPLEKNSTDLFFALDVREHLRDPNEFDSSLFNVLKPGGCFIYSVPNTNGIMFQARVFLGIIFQKKEDPATEDHKNYNWKNDLENVNKTFIVDHVSGYPFFIKCISPSIIVRCYKRVKND
jgi:SAM-dependent methyltransferase